MIILLSFLFIRILVYVNTLYYSMVLLLIVISSIYYLVTNHIIHPLTILILAIVYIGAIIILIGYICAISPNIILTPLYLGLTFYFLILFIMNIFYTQSHTLVIDQNFIPITNYFYSSVGSRIFCLLVFILFITLLIVTSQYITPKGPFRAVSI